MNKPINRYPCGDMGLNAGGGHNPNPPGADGPGYWLGVDGDRSLDAVGPVRVTGRLGHGYALHTNRSTGPDDPPDVYASGISAGDTFPINHNRGVEVIGVGDPDVDYFLPTGFVVRAYCSIDRMPVVGDINYDGTFNPGATIFTLFNQKVGINSAGKVTLRTNDGTNVVSDKTIAINEFHLYELYVEFRHASDDRTTSVAVRVDEEVVAQACVTTNTYESPYIGVLEVFFASYSTGITVDDVAIDAITSGVGHWIGPGECAIIRPDSEVDRPVATWVSGTDYSGENSTIPGGLDPAHPQCYPGILPDWYEALAFEIPYHPWNEAGEEGSIGGSGSAFAVGYVMSNPGGDPTGWDNATFPVCRATRRLPSGANMKMGLNDPGFTPTFSRAFMYAQRSERHGGDTSLGRERVIVHLEVNPVYATWLDFGNDASARWKFSTQYVADDAACLELWIHREVARESIGVNVFAAGSQVGIDPSPGPALPICTPVTPTTGPIICFV